MPRIAGVTIPRSKRTEIGLTYIHGIGRRKARILMKKANVIRREFLRKKLVRELRFIRRTEVMRTVLQNEPSIAGLLVTTEALLANRKLRRYIGNRHLSKPLRLPLQDVYKTLGSSKGPVRRIEISKISPVGGKRAKYKIISAGGRVMQSANPYWKQYADKDYLGRV